MIAENRPLPERSGRQRHATHPYTSLPALSRMASGSPQPRSQGPQGCYRLTSLSPNCSPSSIRPTTSSSLSCMSTGSPPEPLKPLFTSHPHRTALFMNRTQPPARPSPIIIGWNPVAEASPSLAFTQLHVDPAQAFQPQFVLDPPKHPRKTIRPGAPRNNSTANPNRSRKRSPSQSFSSTTSVSTPQDPFFFSLPSPALSSSPPPCLPTYTERFEDPPSVPDFGQWDDDDDEMAVDEDEEELMWFVPKKPSVQMMVEREKDVVRRGRGREGEMVGLGIGL